MTNDKKYMNIPMTQELYDRTYCREMAKTIAKEELITGMTESQLACEIFAHAYVYNNFKYVPEIIRNTEFAKSAYRSTADGVDLEDNGDKFVRRIAYRIIWMMPAVA
ncbi:MAG: hypothetical protein J5685_03850 [Clostridiales bacterium]|nr:hypothetical protein [Clostridiales bacterium]